MANGPAHNAANRLPCAWNSFCFPPVFRPY